ncbi:MAG: acyl-protein synthetase [Bacillota bacterium]|nr:acyl-protein synthetase [Bacillota bacterium]
MSGYDLDSEFVKTLDAEIMALITEGVDARDEERFADLARREFTFQYHNNPVYRKFCAERGITSHHVKDWTEIPPLPVRYFKEQVVSSIPLERAVLHQQSSGTTDPHRRSRIYRDERCTELVFAANRAATKAYLFPDVDRMPILLFVPSPEIAPFMGMAIGLTVMKDSFGTEESCYLIGPEGLDSRTLYRALFLAEEHGRPVALVGATSGFIFFFNQLAQQNLRFRLPAGSRIADGGGYMGTFGECSREEYLAKCWEYLQVPPEYCVNTLGMTECGQNYLDNVLRAKAAGRPAPVRYKPNLPWARTIAVDPETGARVPRGERGWLCHYDLTNRAGVIAVLTDNVGYEVEDGFEIIGRAKGAPSELPAGHEQAMAAMAGALPGSCASTADQMLASHCQEVAERMLAAGAPRFIVDMVARKIRAGEKIHHPFPMRPRRPGDEAGEGKKD